MNAAHNTFHFEQGYELYLFLGLGRCNLNAFSDYIDHLSRTIIPSEVYLIFQENQINDATIQSMMNTLSARFRGSPALLKYNHFGEFPGEEARAENLLDIGLQKIIDIRCPILYPPPGKAFGKPSGRRAHFFIQTSNAFVNHAEMTFIALHLIRKWGKLFDESVHVVYVDTIDLYGLISLASLLRFGTSKSGPITVSFSSYDGHKETLSDADMRQSLMVISATTNHGLLKRIQNEISWNELDRIVTVFAQNRESVPEEAIANQVKVLAYLTPKGEDSHIDLLPAIRLAGEKFQLEIDDPKSVLLKTTERAHGGCLRNLDLTLFLEDRGILSVMGNRNGLTHPFRVDSDRLAASHHFQDWFRDTVKKFAPISTSAVILIGVEKSSLASAFEVFGATQIELLAPEDLRSGAHSLTGSVLVVCPTFTNGSELLEVSRDLRKHPRIVNIVYFAGIGTLENPNDIEKIRKNLEFGGVRIHLFRTFALGSSELLLRTWNAERQFLRNHASIEPDEFSSRADVIDHGSLDDESLFYRVQDLELHSGFRFWQGLTYDPSTRPAVLLYATICHVLQDARCNAQLAESDRLAQLPHRRVLLDSENFFRFNDSLIQVAILRAALPSELDYRDHEHHSRDIAYLFSRSLETGNRALVYEILLAICTKRLHLTQKQTSRLIEIMKSKPTCPEARLFLAPIESLFGVSN